jgi:hypothetical protein
MEKNSHVNDRNTSIGAGRRTTIDIGLAFVSPIGIAASGEDMSMMSQPVE